MYYTEQAVRRIGGEAMVKRWYRKPIGAEGGKWGYDFEDLWAVYQLAKMSSEVIEQLQLGRMPELLDYRINAKRLKCFVDDFDVTRNGFRSLYQLKTGVNFGWKAVDYDFWAQRVLDIPHRISADYHLVVDTWASFNRAVRHLNVIISLGYREYGLILFEATMDYAPFMEQQPRLDEYLTWLCRSTDKAAKRSLFADMLLTCKEPHSVFVLEHVVNEFKHVHVTQPMLVTISAELTRKGFRCEVAGSVLRLSYNGFSGGFVVPCTPPHLDDLQKMVQDRSRTPIEIVDWLLDRGW